MMHWHDYVIYCEIYVGLNSNAFLIVQSGGSLSSTFMDVAKVAITRAATHDSVAIRAEDKSYSFAHLVSSAWSISNLLHAKFSKTVSLIFG